MEISTKRKAPDDGDSNSANKEKKKRQWQTPGRRAATQGTSIQLGDAGIWATCDKGREAKSIGELKDLFQEYSEKLYGDDATSVKSDGVVGDESEVDIESEIQEEVQSMRKPQGKPRFTNVRIDVQCVLFFKTRAPIDPVEVVHTICRDALQTGKSNTRCVKRMTPITKTGKASVDGVEELAKEVLAPHFHSGDGQSKTFKIQVTTRNHDKTLSRDVVINKVASIVGDGHKVNLNNPQLTIIVEIYKFHCGMSVVGADFEELKRFNLTEICSPSGVKEEKKRASESPLAGAAQNR